MEPLIPQDLPTVEARAPWSNRKPRECCQQCSEPLNLSLEPVQSALCIDCAVQGLPFTD